MSCVWKIGLGLVYRLLFEFWIYSVMKHLGRGHPLKDDPNLVRKIRFRNLKWGCRPWRRACWRCLACGKRGCLRRWGRRRRTWTPTWSRAGAWRSCRSGRLPSCPASDAAAFPAVEWSLWHLEVGNQKNYLFQDVRTKPPTWFTDDCLAFRSIS